MYEIIKNMNIMKPMKIIYKKHIPQKGYKAITLFNTIIVRYDCKNRFTPIDYNHESIHQCQAYDFGIGFAGYFIFYILYVLEWLLKLPSALFGYKPYRSISFEQEAYDNQKNLNYRQNRKRFSWLKNLFKLVK